MTMLFGHRLPVKLVISDLAHLVDIVDIVDVMPNYDFIVWLKNGRLVGHYKIPS